MRSNRFDNIACAITIALAIFALVLPARGQGEDPIIAGEALIRLRPGADINAFNAKFNTTTLREIPGRLIYLVKLAPGTDPDQFKQNAGADPDTLWVELNYAGQLAESRGRCFYGIPSAQALPYLQDPAWSQIGVDFGQQYTTGAGTVVAIVDTGIDATHSMLAPVVLPGGWNFVEQNNNTADVGNNLDDDGDGLIDEMTGHGTHVSGIAARVAPDAQLLAVKVADSDGHSNNFLVAEGIFYSIDQGVDVINVSIGSTYNSNAVAEAVAEATNRGIAVIASAGNVDLRTPVEYPAHNAGAIGVTSVDGNDVKAYFSNFHENLAINAPGLEIHSTFPGEQYAPWDGTSMSVPMVSATAAMILSRHPEWPDDAGRVNNVRLALTQTAANVDPKNPGYAGLLGAGRLDVGQAVLAQEAFAGAVEYPVAGGPEAVVIAQLNADEHPDIAVANAAAGVVSVLLNQGDGTFAPHAAYTVDPQPVAIAAGDFDGDQDIDLATASGGRVSVLLNNGDGTFSAGASVTVGGTLVGIFAAQLVSNSVLDLAVADEDDDLVRVLRNTGGGFTVHATIPVGERPYDVAAADLDDDQDIDLVSVNRKSNSISVIRNRGDGTFEAAVSVFTGADPRAMTIGDLDGDLDIDVATANHDSDDATILWNDGGGGFPTRTTIVLSAQRRPERLAVADVNCDDLPDLIATSNDENIPFVSVLLGRGGGVFLSSVDYPMAADPIGVAAASIDADEDADLVIAARGADAISILVNLGCDQIVPGDTNCDGKTDFGDINPFVTALTDPAGYQTAFPDCDIRSADINQDGKVDFGDINLFVNLLTQP